MKSLVLICDDNFAVHESIKTFLNQADIDTLSAYDGEEALRLFRLHKFDLIILDIMLPKIFGTEVCRQIRQSSTTPIIMLSALGSEDDRVFGLQNGADDYVTKPFSPREILARVQAILRRSSTTSLSQHTVFANLQINMDAYSVTVGEQEIALTPNEIKMLAYFVENAGIVLSRERILNAVWGYDYVGDTRAVDAQVKRLRKKLPIDNANFRIQSIYGVGFKLEEIK